MHFGTPKYLRHKPSGGTVRVLVALVPRPSPDPDLVVTWYPHRDAPILASTERDEHQRRVGWLG